MAEDVLVPGGRDVRATLTAADAGACVVACPPHPQHGGSRTDPRLRAVAGALGERGMACLRFDYGAWDEGRGERADAGNAVGWARERYGRVGLFGYSFGAAVALATAAGPSDVGRLCAASVLAPPARSGALDALSAVDGIDAPLQVIFGERDATVDWGPVVEAVRGRNGDSVAIPADHFFVGAREEIGERVAEFFAGRC